MNKKHSLWSLSGILFVGGMVLLSNGFTPKAHGAKRKSIALLFVKKGSNVSDSHFAWAFRLSRWAFRKQPNCNFMGPKEIFGKILFTRKPSRKERKLIKVAKEYLKKGKWLFRNKALGRKRFKYSMKALNKAERSGLSQQKWLTNHTLLRDIFIYKGISYIGLRNAAQTRAYMLKAILFDTQYELEEGVFPAPLIKYYGRLRDSVLDKARYKMAIRTIPRGAKLYFNTKYLGKSPQLIKDIPPGKHTLRIEHPGFLTWRRVITIDPQKLQNKTLIRPNPIALKHDPKTPSLEDTSIFQSNPKRKLILARLQAIQKKTGADYIYAIQPHAADGHIFRIAIFRKNSKSVRYTKINVGRGRSAHRRAILSFLRRENSSWAK